MLQISLYRSEWDEIFFFKNRMSPELQKKLEVIEHMLNADALDRVNFVVTNDAETLSIQEAD